MHGWKYSKVTTYTCEVGISVKMKTCETGIAANNIDSFDSEGKNSLRKNEQTDSTRSAGLDKTVLEHSRISGMDNRGAAANESDSSEQINEEKEKFEILVPE